MQVHKNCWLLGDYPIVLAVDYSLSNNQLWDMEIYPTLRWLYPQSEAEWETEETEV